MAPSEKATKPRSAAPSGSTITDPRFRNIHTDPRYRLPSKKHTHVQLDKRFSRMLKDDDFSRKASVDRYGRKLDKSAGRKELERFYRVQNDEDEDDEDEEDLDVAGESGEDDEVVQRELRRAEQRERGYDPAREGGFSSSSEDSESDEEDEDDVDVEDEAELPEQGQEGQVEMGEVTSRLAVVNLDWDNIRAVDLMAVSSSFLPPGGDILSVAVYPSEFGRERIEREELEGPPREIFAAAKAQEQDEGEEDTSDEEAQDERIKKSLQAEQEASDFNPTALREYQLQRLRYYYAVLTISSPDAAEALYKTLDGREYLSSANFFDLRFIPDETDFSSDMPRDECTTIPDGYRPTDFVTDALQHSKVRLTWDEDDKQRKEAQKRAFGRNKGDIEENDLQAYIGGSDSSEDEDDGDIEVVIADTNESRKENKKKDKATALRAALGLSAEPAKSSKSKLKSKDEPVGDMQITFTSAFSNPGKGSVFENAPASEETTKEKYVRLEKERKARRKERLKATHQATDAQADGTHDDQEDAADAVAQDDADPFDDPFFEDPVATTAAAEKQARKEEKARKRERKAAEEAKAAAERAELALLMSNEKGEEAGVRHFDMNAIMKAEKAARKKGKKGREAKRLLEEAQKAGEVEKFEVDTKDPRFGALYESHEYAIDPTNPRFRDTAGMKALLEEGRRKRKESGGAAEEDVPRAKKSKRRDGDTEGGEDLQNLVDRVKGKAKLR